MTIETSNLDLTKSRSQMVLIEAIRVIVLSVILLITLISQALQVQFINLGTLFPIFIVLFIGFSINFIYLFSFDKLLRYWYLPAILFSLEVILITSLIYFSGISQSLFLFMYLVNIILAGLVYKSRGALYIAGFTSILFSLLTAAGSQVSGQALFFSLTLNIVSFFAVAALSGYLSEQINFMGVQLKEKRRDLKVLQRLNNLIVQNIPSGLLTIMPNGEIVQYNLAALEIIGSQEELNGKNIFSVFPEIEEPFEKARLRDSSQRTSRFDLNFQKSTDEKLILNFTVSSLEDPERLTNGYVIIFEDQTKIRKLEYQVRQSEKMAAIGGLAAGIAHEIRNPLASISGSIQMMSMSITNEDDKRLVNIVLRETDRLNGLITEFLDYSRPDIPLEDTLDLNKLLAEVLEVIKFNPQLRSNVLQKVSLQSKSLILGHRDKMKQALMNMLINSYQAMTDSESPVLEVTTEDREEKLILKISDSGCGMTEDGRKRMFEPFHTTKHKGTGLGLAVTHKILENHSAEIFVESEKGKGTTITVEFPIKH